MTDAERLMRPYMELVAQSPSRIAPERAGALLDTVFGGKVADFDFTNGDANFAAYVSVPKVEATFSALLSLWATARASLHIAQAAADARRQGIFVLPVARDTPLYNAYQLVAAAKALIANSCSTWPKDLSPAEPGALPGTRDAGVNNLFLGATGWVALHEIAHIHLQHEVETIDDLRRRQEYEADLWATKWILDDAPHDPTREFRVFSIATGLAWLVLVNTVRRSTITHPPAPLRLLNCAGEFMGDDLSPALEMAGDVLKVLFDPSARLQPSEHPAEAFERLAMHLRTL